jgi:hypothetical protein
MRCIIKETAMLPHQTSTPSSIRRLAPAIDTGVNVDFEGDPRAQGGGFDIGFDETSLIPILEIRLFLPLVRRSP